MSVRWFILQLLLATGGVHAWQKIGFIAGHPFNSIARTSSVRTSSNALHAWNSFPFSKANGKPPKAPKISVEAKEAYEFWRNLNGDMRSTAPNYLTLDMCADKFDNLVATVGDAASALAIVAADSTILSYSKERVSESFNAWELKIGNREETIRLVTRNPPILSIGPLFIDAAKPPDVAQTYFWSYVAVLLRPISLGLQKLVSGIIKSTS